MKQVLPKFCNPTGKRHGWLVLPEDANKLRALMGRAGDADTAKERTEATGRGDCNDGSDEADEEAGIVPPLP